MRLPIPHLFLLCVPLTSALAQQTGPLLTFSQLEYTQSLGGGPLQMLHPNEIAFLPWPASCNNGNLTEKWSPLTCLQVMAGDENGDGDYWNPSLFGSIDALAIPKSWFGPVKVDPRSVFWSPSAPTGTNICASPLRPGDMGRIAMNGQVELLMSQESFNKALGLPPNYPIDIDAFDHEPGVGIFFSVDNDSLPASLGCSALPRQDGSLFAIRDDGIAISWSLGGFFVVDVQLNSAYVVMTEAQIDALLVNSNIADRFGAAVTQAIDLEALDIIPGSAITLVTVCPNVQVPVPDFRFTTESMTGGSLMTTLFGGSVSYSSCGYGGYHAPGVQNGYAVGIQGSPQLGPPSYVNALALATTERFALEPQAHVLNYGLQGGPGTTVHVGGPWPWVFNWLQFVSPTVPGSLNAWPFSPTCFPDLYFPDFVFWGYTPMIGYTQWTSGFGSFNTPSIPAGWSGKLLFQCIALNGPTWELSTPTVIDVH